MANIVDVYALDSKSGEVKTVALDLDKINNIQDKLENCEPLLAESFLKIKAAETPAGIKCNIEDVPIEEGESVYYTRVYLIDNTSIKRTEHRIRASNGVNSIIHSFDEVL